MGEDYSRYALRHLLNSSNMWKRCCENSFAGIAQTFADSVPMLVLPGQYDQHRIGIFFPTFFCTSTKARKNGWIPESIKKDKWDTVVVPDGSTHLSPDILRICRKIVARYGLVSNLGFSCPRPIANSGKYPWNRAT